MTETKESPIPAELNREVISELVSVLREMLEYAEARNRNKKARTVNMKFSRLTLEMWMEKASSALSNGEGLLLRIDPKRFPGNESVAADLSLDRIHEVEYDTTHSSGRPRWSCYSCNDTIIRLPHLSDQDWDQAVAIFKRQHNVL